MKPYGAAVEATLLDLRRPVAIRDVRIMAYGEPGEIDANDEVEWAKSSGYPSGYMGNVDPILTANLQVRIEHIGDGNIMKGLQLAASGLNLYRIEMDGFDHCKDIIEPVLSVLVAAADEDEARRVAYIHAMAVAEENMHISPLLDTDDDGDDFWLLEYVEKSGPAYEREANKFLDNDHSKITLLGTSVEKESCIIDEHRMIYE